MYIIGSVNVTVLCYTVIVYCILYTLAFHISNLVYFVSLARVKIGNLVIFRLLTMTFCYITLHTTNVKTGMTQN